MPSTLEGRHRKRPAKEPAGFFFAQTRPEDPFRAPTLGWGPSDADENKPWKYFRESFETLLSSRVIPFKQKVYYCAHWTIFEVGDSIGVEEWILGVLDDLRKAESILKQAIIRACSMQKCTNIPTCGSLIISRAKEHLDLRSSPAAEKQEGYTHI
ncbi:hypothetical protein BGZ60DRAFT_16622 [Tricladium varicosporioides]|nr:hypothetical protein BGZ60DRAFT_16622 [Hymenoscyphus varicosporioides]